jgi:hypothetical protein
VSYCDPRRQLVQQHEEGRQQDAINEYDNEGGDQAGGVRTNSGEADSFPGEIRNENVENPRDDRKQRNGGLTGIRDEKEKSGVTSETKENVESGNDQRVGEGAGSGPAGKAVKQNQIRSDRGQAPSEKAEV